MEYWLLALIVVVLLMAEVLRLLNRSRKGGKKYSSAPAANKKFTASRRVNYALAPRDPEVMAGALFEQLSQILNAQQLSAFASLVTSPEMTDRYIERLASRQSTAAIARQLAFLCDSMEANGYTASDRATVANALQRKADKEYKLLQIHKNLDKIF